MVHLRGITWRHTRGYAPLVATAQAWMDARPDTEILWDRRSLSAFSEAAIEGLAQDFDLLVIDHPFVGLAADRELLVPLDEELPATFLSDQARGSTGASFRSYTRGGHQWALAVDASAQTSAARTNLLEELGVPWPATWDDVLLLARRRMVALPLAPIDALSTFFALCAQRGDPPGRFADRLVSDRAGAWALETFRALFDAVDPSCLQMTPPSVLARMATSDDIAYAPMLYAYSNYARDGFAPKLVTFGDVPDGELGGGTLGGAGLAVSARSANREAALAYAAWVSGADVQRSLYVLAGGQPGHRAAWEDDVANQITRGFFRAVLPTVERAYLRPTHPRFPAFQAEAGLLLHDFLLGRRTDAETLRTMNARYEWSLKGEKR